VEPGRSQLLHVPGVEELGIQLPSASVGHVLIEAVPGEEEVRRRALEANWRKR